MGTIRKISVTVWESIKLVWRRLPFIALYSFCLAVVWVVGSFAIAEVDKQFVRAADTDRYIKYTSFTVNNIREGEDLTYTVCRDFKGRYQSEGKRTVYIVPEGKTVNDRAFLYNKDYKGTIEGDPCQSYVVMNSTYHLKPGRYQLTLSGDIIVQYDLRKPYFVESQVFTVYPQPSGVPTLRTQIFSLTPEEIEELKRVLGVEQSATSASTSSSTSTPPRQISPLGTVPTPSSSPSPSPSPSPRPATTTPPCVLGLLNRCILGTQ